MNVNHTQRDSMILPNGSFGAISEFSAPCPKLPLTPSTRADKVRSSLAVQHNLVVYCGLLLVIRDYWHSKLLYEV
jgi:hypothetical protein